MRRNPDFAVTVTRPISVHACLRAGTLTEGDADREVSGPLLAIGWDPAIERGFNGWLSYLVLAEGHGRPLWVEEDELVELIYDGVQPGSTSAGNGRASGRGRPRSGRLSDG
jgi:hypothetical protein